MKGSDIANILKTNITKYTNFFSGKINISNIVFNNNIATITLQNNYFLPNDFGKENKIRINGIKSYVNIASITEHSPFLLKITTTSSHLLEDRETFTYTQKITIENTDPIIYNKEYEIKEVLSSTEVLVISNPLINDPITTQGRLVADNVFTMNKSYNINVVNETTFEIQNFYKNYDYDFTNGYIDDTNVELIINCANDQRMLDLIHKKSTSNEYENMLFVILDESQAYNNNDITTNDISGIKKNDQNYSFRYAQNLSVFAVLNTKNDETGGEVSDIARNELKIAIFKSLTSTPINSPFVDKNTQSKQYQGLVMASDNSYELEGSLPFYVHGYSFTTYVELSGEDLNKESGSYVPFKEVESTTNEGASVQINNLYN